MDLDQDECWRRLEQQRRATFATVHPARGVDAVPAVYATTPDRRIVIPVDTVKPKRTTALQRLDNLRADDRCVLLVDHYDEDWSRLWWVRVHGRATEAAATSELVELLAARYRPYAEPGAVAATIVLTPDRVTGWSAAT